MFKVELISLVTPPATYILCDSSRSLAEHNLRLNGRRIVDYVELVRADYAQAFDLGNRRNVFSFDVTRDVDFDGKAFRDPEAAMIFALDQDALIPVISHARLTFIGSVTTAVRWLANCSVETTDLSEVLGVAHKYNYTLNGAGFSALRPAIPV